MNKKWKAFFDSLEKIIINIASVLMGLMAIFVVYQVFSRYVLRYAPYWTEEITTNVMMWVSLLAMACGAWTDSHMDLAMLVERFPKSVQVWLRVLSDLLIGLFAYYLLVDGISLVAQTMNGVLSSMPVPIGYTYLIIPISGGLTLCFVLLKAFSRLMNFYVWKETVSEGVGIHG